MQFLRPLRIAVKKLQMSQPPWLEARISRLGMTLTGPQQPLRPFVSWKQSLCPELDMIKMSQTVK